jgi:hypothetical protein
MLQELVDASLSLLTLFFLMQFICQHFLGVGRMMFYSEMRGKMVLFRDEG